MGKRGRRSSRGKSAKTNESGMAPCDFISYFKLRCTRAVVTDLEKHTGGKATRKEFSRGRGTLPFDSFRRVATASYTRVPNLVIQSAIAS